MAAIPVTEILEHTWHLITATGKYTLLAILGLTAYRKRPRKPEKILKTFKEGMEITTILLQKYIIYGVFLGGIMNFLSGKKLLGHLSVLLIIVYGFYKIKDREINDKELIEGKKSYLEIGFILATYTAAVLATITNLKTLNSLAALGLVGWIFWKL